MTAFATDLDPRYADRLRRAGRLLIVASLGICGLVLLGWLLDVPVLRTLGISTTTMKPWTAIMLLVLGVVYLLPWPLNPVLRWGAFAGLVAVALVCAVLLLEFVTPLRTGLGEWWFPRLVRAEEIQRVGLPAPNTLAALLLLSLAWFDLSFRARLGTAFTLVALLIGWLAVLGRFYGAEEFFQASVTNPIASHTGLVLVFLSLAGLMRRLDQPYLQLILGRQPGGLLARSLIPAAVLVPVVVGWLRLQGQRLGWYGTEIGLALYTTSNVVVFAALALLSARLLNRTDAQRRAVHTALGASEERFRLLADAAPNGLIMVDTQGHIVLANRRAAGLFGYTQDQLLALHIEDLVPQRFRGGHPHLRQAYVTHPEARLMGAGRDLYGLRQDGAEFPVEIGLSSMVTSEGVFTLASVIDITARKQTESVLRTSEQQLRWTLQASQAGAWVWNLQTGVADWTPEMYRLWGVAPGTLMVTENSLALVDDRDRQRVADQIGAAIASHADVHYEFRIHHATLGPRWMETYGRAIYDGAGNAVTMLGLTLDITQRKEAEAALQQLNTELEQRVRERTLELSANEAKLRALFEVLPVGVSILDQNRKMTDSNPALLRILESTHAGLAAGLYTKRRYISSDGEPLPTSQMPSVRALAEGQSVMNVEMGVVTESGRTVWTSVSAVPLPPPNSGVVLVTADVTERRQAATELTSANDRLTHWVAQLESSNREVSLLAQLGSMLQAAHTLDEAAEVVASFGQMLYPEASGTLALLNASRTLISPTSQWNATEASNQLFGLDECWALRRGRLHASQGGEAGVGLTAGPRCAHLQAAPPAAALCIPLMNQTESLGVLVLQVSSPGEAAERLISPSGQQLAQALADHVGLALGNLKLRESLRQQSIRDALTGLYNRRFLVESLDRELARAERAGQPLALVMFDVDHFKAINDRYGHETGDRVLQEMGAILSKHVRAGDLACRLGGEEFVLLLPGCNLETAARRAEMLRSAVSQARVVQRAHALEALTVSAGVAGYPGQGATSQELLHAADMALYEAKRLGRNQVVVAESPAA